MAAFIGTYGKRATLTNSTGKLSYKIRWTIATERTTIDAKICYAENDHAVYKATEYEFPLPFMQANAWRPLADVKFQHGAPMFREDQYAQYIEYEIIGQDTEHSAQKKADDYLQFDLMIKSSSSDTLYKRHLYPSACIYYHPTRSEESCFSVNIDQNKTRNRGRRTPETWQTVPLTVKIEWFDAASPEILERDFYIAHVASGKWNGVEFSDLLMVPMNFTMIDAPIDLVNKSLRLDGGLPNLIDGSIIGRDGNFGDEKLYFLCNNCGSDANLAEV